MVIFSVEPCDFAGFICKDNANRVKNKKYTIFFATDSDIYIIRCKLMFRFYECDICLTFELHECAFASKKNKIYMQQRVFYRSRFPTSSHDFFNTSV